MPHKFFEPVPGDTPAMPLNKAVSFSFSDPKSKGIWMGGRIVTIDDTRFVVDIPSRAVKTWPGTSIPIPTLVFHVMACGEERTLWVPKELLYTDDGLIYPGTRYRALREAMENAGQPEELPAIGWFLWMRWVGQTYTGPSRYPRKLWEVKYELEGELK